MFRFGAVARAMAAVTIVSLLLVPAPGSAQSFRPPDTVHRQVLPTCDLNGDGVDDYIENAYQTNGLSAALFGTTTITARSGAHGGELWRAEGLFFMVHDGDHGISLARPGLPDPQGAPNVVVVDDWTHDGACDLITWGLARQPGGVATPFFGSPALLFADATVRLMDGATGNTTWSVTLPQESITANDPFGVVTNERHTSLPTDFRVMAGEGWKRLLLKTTDVSFNQASDLGLTALATGTPFWYVDAVLQETYYMFNETGDQIWRHASTPSANETVLTWISALHDVNGDNQPDIIVDQTRMANPRTAELAVAAGEEPAQPYRNGRGMSVVAIDGNPDGTGDTLWSTEVRPLVPVEPQADTEETVEAMTWTHARLIPDITGDGVADVVAQWLGIEQAAAASVDGSARTHFVPLDAATGAPFWEAKVQGWGFLRELGPGLLAAATTDMPSAGTGVGYVPKGARIVALDQGTGENVWAREQPQMPGDESYSMTQWQWYHSFGDDGNGDGVVDPFMPARRVGAVGSEQVFRATAREAFDRLDGRTGEVIASHETWGSRGIMADCGDGVPTAFVGHSERVEVVRWEDPPDNPFSSTVEASQRTELWKSIDAGASTLGVSLVALGAHCGLRDGSVWFSTNMERFSFWRAFEIVPSFGVLDDGHLRWSVPSPDNSDPGPGLLQEAALRDGRFIQSTLELVTAIGVAVVAAALLALALAPLVRRRRAAARNRADPLGIMLVLFLIPTPGMIGADGGAPDVDAIPIPDPDDVDGDPASGSDGVEDAGLVTPARKAAAPPTDGNGQPTVAAPPQAGQASQVIEEPGTTIRRNLTLPDGGLALPGGGPVSHLLTTLSARDSRPSDVGWAFMAAARGDQQPFDAIVNPAGSVSYEHLLGDVDGDGVDDVALDILCLDYRECRRSGSGLLDPVSLVQYYLSAYYCGPYHVLVAVSGASGEPLWHVPMVDYASTAQGFADCSVNAVIGMVPTADGPAILAQRFNWNDPTLVGSSVVIHHDVYLLDATTGVERWNIPFEGFLANGLLRQYVAETLFVKPHLVNPEENHPGVQGIADGQLLLQGIGFTASSVQTIFTLPGINRGVEIVDSYYPNEWLARVNIDTGELVYREPILTPVPGRSQMPWPSLVTPFSTDDYSVHYRGYSDEMPYGQYRMAWSPDRVSADVDGDGIADLVSVTREWRDLRTLNTDGREGFGASAMAWSGATGSLLFRTTLLENIDAPTANGRHDYYNRNQGLNVHIRPAGDIDGDGGMDLLVQLRLRMADYEDQIHVLDGDTGSVLWTQRSLRWQEIYPLGDADGDGGVDFVFMHWWTQENRATIFGDGRNVTARGIRVLDGDTGQLIRTTNTISAPFDLQAIYSRLQADGFPDVDGDGVGDYPIDDPIFLPDGLVLHQTSWVSGFTGEILSSMTTAGALAFPSRLPDVTGDGIDDVALLAGDPIDLWLVYSDGRTGKAFGSHRAMASEIGSYGRLLPQVRVRAIDAGGAPGVVVGIHMEATFVSFASESYGFGGEVYRSLYLDDTIVPQMFFIEDLETANGWSFPDAHDTGAHAGFAGTTPGTQALLDIRREAEPTPMEITRDLVAETWPVALAFVLVFSLVLGTAVYWPRRTS